MKREPKDFQGLPYDYEPIEPTAQVDAFVIRGLYKEDDWVAEVEIIEDRSTNEHFDYTLKVLENIQQTNIYKPVQVGEVFEYFKLRGSNVGGLGRLDIYD